MIYLLLLLSWLPAVTSSQALDEKDIATLGAMRAELSRASQLKLQNRAAPYYTSYWVVDLAQHDVHATLGALVGSDFSETRRVKTEVRVGSPALDNSNYYGSGFSPFSAGFSPSLAPRSDPAALRHALWLETDAAYKHAVETLEQRRASRQREVVVEDVPSFSESPIVELYEPPGAAVTDDPAHIAYAERVSAVFRGYPQIQDSWVHVVVSTERRYFTATDGTVAVVQTPYTDVEIHAETQAEDGMALARSARLATLSTELPSEAEAIAEATRVAEELVTLSTAPILQDYSGPVLFEGRAAPQLATELLAASLSGTPPPKGAEGMESPLARKLGKRILPKTVSVFDDPTLSTHEGLELIGSYRLDDEGVAAERVELVEDGRLRSLLMSRAPSKEQPSSNGHGRSGLSGWARGHPGNLIVESRAGRGRRALERQLLGLAREEGLDHALIVTELEPRAGATSGHAPPAPHVVYRVGTDGKRELLRGGAFGELSVRDLRFIVGVGKKAHVYHYPAPSAGGFAIPVSVVSPALLFESVEFRRPTEPNPRKPIVPRPELPPPPQGSLQQRNPVE